MMMLKLLRKIKQLLYIFYKEVVTYFDFFCSLFPGRLGNYIRRVSLKNRVKIGKNVDIDEFVNIRYPNNLSIGDNTFIGNNSFIQASGHVSIGKDVQIAPYVKIWSADQIFENIDTPIYKQGHNFDKVTIEDDCWIGTGYVILKGITIGKGSVIGACSVVTKNIPPIVLQLGIQLE